MTAAVAEWRSHWGVAVASSVGVATGFSMLQFNTSILIQSLQAQFGWTRGEIAAAHNSMILTALLTPFAGALLDIGGAAQQHRS